MKFIYGKCLASYPAWSSGLVGVLQFIPTHLSETIPAPGKARLLPSGGKTVYCHWSSVQSLSRVQLFATPWTAACQASLSITSSWSLLRLTSIELVVTPLSCWQSSGWTLSFSCLYFGGTMTLSKNWV